MFERGGLARLDAENFEELDEEVLRLRLLVVGKVPVLCELRRIASYVVPAFHDGESLGKKRSRFARTWSRFE